ncbi:MAG: hypothetical protein NUK63_09065 [Candidatus Bathyarchaeum tardum]|nr:MAG: hypothetical protein NUK63_09065 [Candidatus Bathyarchaeum tardum]
MTKIGRFDELAQNFLDKTITKKQLLKMVKEDSSLIPLLLEGVGHKKASVRYGCSSVLMNLSENNPELLYPEFDFFVKLLDIKYRILTWNAFTIIANLTQVDDGKKFDAIFEKYYSFLDNEYMVTVANVVGNSGKIANSKPYFVPKITEKLLRVQNLSTTPHLTEECKKVIAQQAIASFDLFFDNIGQQQEQVINFVKSHVGSSRKKLNKKAEKFLEKWTRKATSTTNSNSI